MNDVSEAPRLPALQAGGSVKAIVPQDFDGAWRIAVAVVKAGMAPKGLETPEKAMVAIMHGLEVGMTPMAALQSIAVVNGRPTIWGDGAIGLVRGSGKCEWIKERIDGEGDNMVAVCEVKRKGETDPIKGSFSVADAKKASLWGKAGPWQQYPKRMLAMRARAFALRDGFADILRGLGIAEEVQDTPMRDVTPPAPPVPPQPPAPPTLPVATIDHVADAIDADPPEDDAPEVYVDDRTYFEQLQDAMDLATDAATVEEVWTEFDPLARFEGKPNFDQNQGIAKAIKLGALKRIGGG
jgi:hypothetical protein